MMDSERVTNCVKSTTNLLREIVLLLVVTLYTYGEKFIRLFVPRPLKSLEGEIILVSGSGNGIGKQIANELAGKGATIICWDIDAIENNKTVEVLKHRATTAFGYTVDISKRESVRNVAEMVRSDVGDVSIVINNAGIVPNGQFLDIKEDLLEKVYEVNTLSHLWILRQFLPSMIEKGRGHVVTTASITAYVPTREIAAYASSKHAVTGFIDSLRQEIREHPKKPDIKFTTAYPAFVQTRLLDGITIKPKYDVFPLLTPEYVGRKIVEGFCQNYDHVFLPPHGVILALLSKCCPQRIMEQLYDGIISATLQRKMPNVSDDTKKSK